MNNDLKIVRTAVGCLSSVGLINELKKNSITVIGTDCDSLSAGLYLCDKGYVIPRGDDPTFIEEMLNICENEKPNAIISGPEEELLALSKNKELFNELDVLLLCPEYETMKICNDKVKTHETLTNLNIPVPKLYHKDEAEFPCIVKPRSGRGGRGIFKIENEKELQSILKKNSNQIIQEYVDGEEYTIDTFADNNGTPLSVIPRRRLQVESGISVKGVTVDDQVMIEYCNKIVCHLKLFGPSCIQCIKNKNGDIKFLEINPRFGGGSILSIKANPTILQNLIKIIDKENPIPNNNFTKGLINIRYYSEVFLNENKLKEKLIDKTICECV